jgi:hypothetical protein
MPDSNLISIRSRHMQPASGRITTTLRHRNGTKGGIGGSG